MQRVTSSAERAVAPESLLGAPADAPRPEGAAGSSSFLSATELPPASKLFVPRLLRPIPSIAGLAWQAAAAGFAPEAELLYRHAFARGESGPWIERSIRQQTARLFAKGLKLSVIALSPRGVERDIPVRNSADLRRVLQQELGSRLTLMDLVELMDVGRPRIRLQGLTLECAIDREGISSIGITGNYDLRRLENGWYRYECCFELDRGRPTLLARSIRVSELIKGCGIGARSLLALAQFCARHEVSGWNERVQDDGIFAWRRLGGRLDPQGLIYAKGLLESLAESDAVSQLGLHAVDWSDPESIATVRVHPRQIRDAQAFEHWLHEKLRLCDAEISALPHPYPVGYQSLRSSPLYAGYETTEIFRHLVEEYFPRRIVDGGGAGITEAFSSAERERDLLKLSESAAARHLASSLIVARAEARSATISGFAPESARPVQAPVSSGSAWLACSSGAHRPAVPLFTPAVALLPRLFSLRGR